MTLQELLAHNEAVRKRRAEEAAKKLKEQKEFEHVRGLRAQLNIYDEVVNTSEEASVEATEEPQNIETEEVAKPKSKKGRKPKSRAYLVAEDLPFEEDEQVTKIVEEENIATDDGDSKLEEEVC